MITDAYEEHPYDLLICVPPHRARRSSSTRASRPPSGWVPTDRHTLQVKTVARPPRVADETSRATPTSTRWATRPTCRCPRRAPRPTSRRPVVAERIAAAVEGREPAGKDASYTGRVMCFFEVGDGKGTLLRFDYDHPPKPPTPGRLWHLGKVVFNKTYWHTVPRGRI